MIILEVVQMKGRPIGLVAATSKSHIGYALYNTAKEKRDWDLGFATNVAVGRAEKGIDSMSKLGELSERFRLEMKKNKDATNAMKYISARYAYGRVFFLTKIVEKMILKAKRVKW